MISPYFLHLEYGIINRGRSFGVNTVAVESYQTHQLGPFLVLVAAEAVDDRLTAAWADLL